MATNYFGGNTGTSTNTYFGGNTPKHPFGAPQPTQDPSYTQRLAAYTGGMTTGMPATNTSMQTPDILEQRLKLPAAGTGAAPTVGDQSPHPGDTGAEAPLAGPGYYEEYYKAHGNDLMSPSSSEDLYSRGVEGSNPYYCLLYTSDAA